MTWLLGHDPRLYALAAALVLLAFAFGGLLESVLAERRIAREQELAACEPPARGQLHFVDGPIRQYAECRSPAEAIERLTREAFKR